MRFLFWVVKVTHGASSRVQGLGEQTRGLSPALSCVGLSSFPFVKEKEGEHSLCSGNGHKGPSFGLDHAANLTYELGYFPLIFLTVSVSLAVKRGLFISSLHSPWGGWRDLMK